MALEEQSEAALRRLPRAGAEIARAEGDVRALSASVASVLGRLEEAQKASAASVGPLASLDGARRRLERARGTLAEAAGLADLLERSSTLLATGDVRALADALAAMRRALKVVGAAPEFAAGAARVAALEDALEKAVAPALQSALQARDAQRSGELAELLGSAGREEAVERAFVGARLPSLLLQWEGHLQGEEATAPPPLAQALQLCYDELVAAAQQEVRWVGASLPARSPALPLALLAELAQRTAKPLQQRITEECGAPASQGGAPRSTAAGGPSSATPPPTPLPTLLALHAPLAACTTALARLFQGAPPRALRGVLEALLRPLDPWLCAYGDAERRGLTASLARLDLRDAGGLAAAARRMGASVPQAAELVADAARRCALLTGGAEADALLRACDDALLSYLTSVHALLRRQRATLGLGSPGEASASTSAASDASDAPPGPPGAGHPHPWASALPDETLQAAVELLPVGRALLSRLAQVEGALTASLGEASLRLAHALPPPGDVEESDAAARAREGALLEQGDAAALRLAATPERARRLRTLLSAAAEPRFAALPHAAPRAAALADALSDFVFDCLMARVRAACQGLAGAPHWAQQEPPSEAAFALPSFSASPLEYVQQLGEYLLTLPQLLEAVEAPPTPRGDASARRASMDEPEGGGGGEDGFATAWLLRLCDGASGALCAALLAVKQLSPRGARQMEADVDYFCNVLSALAVAPTQQLQTLRALAACTAEELPAAVTAAARGGEQVDTSIADALARMRAAAVASV